MPTKETNSPFLDRPIQIFSRHLTVETLVYSLIILLAIISRITDLGIRPLSHDESIHIYFSYLFSTGEGYFHTPLSHGPLQYHLIALLFFIFGENDFWGRFPQAIASIVAILMLWKWRAYLGRLGSIFAAILMLISPFMLYYGRYARNESLVIVVGLISLYSILRYLETGNNRFLLMLTVSTALHFTIKETSFIYTAQALVFLGMLFISEMLKKQWKLKKYKKYFIFFLIAFVLLLAIAIGSGWIEKNMTDLGGITDTTHIIVTQKIESSQERSDWIANPSNINILILLCGLAGLSLLLMLVIGVGWNSVRQNRSFSILILLFSLILPMLSAFPANWFGWNPLDYSFTWPGWNIEALFAQPPVKTGVVFLSLISVSLILGFMWDKKRWLINFALFWGIYFVLYSSLFSNPGGFFTGSIGSLGYWIEQQAVHRGNQPWYYYLLLQVPVYEFLPFIGFLFSILLKIRENIEIRHGITKTKQTESGTASTTFFPLLIWWGVSSLFAFSIAGEKMPWLTIHIILPMTLLSGWAMGKILEEINWTRNLRKQFLLITLLMSTFILIVTRVLSLRPGNQPPFGEKTEEILKLTNTFIFQLILLVAIGGLIFHIYRKWKFLFFFQLLITTTFGFLALITCRNAFRAAFVNSEFANEFLVYAHGTSGIKTFLGEIKLISQRADKGYTDLIIAYDAGNETQGVSWPMKWYLRRFPNAFPFYEPNEMILQASVIIADQQSYVLVDELTLDNYYIFDSTRMVWPNQDYFDLNISNIIELATNRVKRNAIFQIWYNRNYYPYSLLKGENGFSLSNWTLRDNMRLYVRKDIAEKIWEYNLLEPYISGESH